MADVPGFAGIIIPWSAELDLVTISADDGLCSMRLPSRAALADHADGIAPGAVASLIDHVCGAAIMSRQMPISISTLNLKIDHIRPATPGSDVTAWGHCYRMTDAFAFVRVEVWDQDPSDVFATAQAVFSVKHRTAA